MALTVAAQDSQMDCGPGLWARTFLRPGNSESRPVLTNLRVAGTGRKRGSLLINAATALLMILAIALYVVSINAQWKYVMDVKHDDLVSWIEAASLDGGMAVFTLLALGLSRAGQPARIERLCIVACALGSGVMNYAAASAIDVRSELAYTVPPLFLAGVVDRTVSVIRRHYLGDEDASAWSNLGRVSLYSLRLVAAPLSTVSGLRRVLLNRTPLPSKPAPVKAIPFTWPPVPSGPVVALDSRPRPIASRPEPVTSKARKPKTTATKRTASGGSKQSDLIKLATNDHGLADCPLDKVSRLATRLAPEVGIHPATARRVLLAHARELQNGEVS